MPHHESPGAGSRRCVFFLNDIENRIKAQQLAGYEHWVKIHNLKQAAGTMNFLTKHRIEQYTELTARIAAITVVGKQAAEEPKGVEKRINSMAYLSKTSLPSQKQGGPMWCPAKQNITQNNGRNMKAPRSSIRPPQKL